MATQQHPILLLPSSPSPSLCDRCSEPIFSNQEAIPTPSRRLFHRNCFACSKRQCGRILSLGEYGVHQKQIFCPECFLCLLKTNLNGPLSNGKLVINGGNSIDKPEGENGQGPTTTTHFRSYEHQLRTLQLHEDDEEGEGEGGEEDDDEHGEEDDGDDRSGKLVAANILMRLDQSARKRSFGASPIPELDELESEQSQPSPNQLPPSILMSPTWRIAVAASSPSSFNNGRLSSVCSPLGTALIPFRPSNCKRCSGRVYEAEKVVAASEVWHKCCFRCLRCGRSLEPGKFSDRASEIYCNSCYAKEFGPKGVGCGVGAGILQMHQ